MSHVVTFRLRPDELEMLEFVRRSEVRGDCSTSEFFRLMLHREFRRRKGLEKPSAAAYQSDFRTGRPGKV